MDGLYRKSKLSSKSSKTTIVALPERRDTFHGLKMVGKENGKKMEKISTWRCSYKVGISRKDMEKFYQQRKEISFENDCLIGSQNYS